MAASVSFPAGNEDVRAKGQRQRRKWIPAFAGMTSKGAFTRRGGPLWPPVSEYVQPRGRLRMDRHGGLSLRLVSSSGFHRGVELPEEESSTVAAFGGEGLRHGSDAI